MFDYILDMVFSDELTARQDYLLHTFHLYFPEISRTDSYIKLRSFPFQRTEIVIIYGHYPWVCDYLHENEAELRRRVKIIHSCCPDIILSQSGQQQVYFCKVNQFGDALRYDGKLYGIPFNVTASELDALNTAHLPLWEQIRFAYKRVA